MNKFWFVFTWWRIPLDILDELSLFRIQRSLHMFCCSPMFVGAKIILWGNVSRSKCREQIMRHGSDPGDVCVVQGRSVVVTWPGSGQVKVQKKQANVKDGDYVITPYRSLAERDRPPVYRFGVFLIHLKIDQTDVLKPCRILHFQIHSKSSISHFNYTIRRPLEMTLAGIPAGFALN